MEIWWKFWKFGENFGNLLKIPQIWLKKIGKWIGSAKRYFSDFQKEITDIETSVDNEISLENKFENKTKDKKDEWWKDW